MGSIYEYLTRESIMGDVEKKRKELSVLAAFDPQYKKGGNTCPGECIVIQAQMPRHILDSWEGVDVSDPSYRWWRAWRVEPDHMVTCPSCSEHSDGQTGFFHMLPAKFMAPALDMTWAQEVFKGDPYFPTHLGAASE